MMKTTVAKFLTFGVLLCIPLLAQGPPSQLDSLVEPIALYPDPLLAQVLTASTYWDQIPEAKQWSDAHSYLNGQQLANAIQDDQLPWDPSVLALLPFPTVLDQLANDPGWTQALGNAVLDNRAYVMDSIQHMRREAMDYGYLQSNQYYRVTNSGSYIDILPMNAGYFYVPSYNPAVIFARPGRRRDVGAVIHFGPRVQVGAYFAPFGWREPSLAWGQHNIIINHHPWARTRENHEHYQHPYNPPIRRPENHDRGVASRGREGYVEHHDRARQSEHGKGDHGRGGGRDHGHDHR